MSATDRTPAMSLAVRNLRRNKLQTILAVLGVCIGVFAIASLGIFGNVLAIGADNAIGDLGAEAVVSPNTDQGLQQLTDADVTAMKRAVGDEATVIPIRSGGTVVESNNDQSFATIYGINRPGAAYTAAEGRLPDRLRQGAVVGAGLASSLDISVGQTVEIEGEQIRVIAILESQETFSPVAPDSAVILPESAFQSDGYDQVLLRAETGEEAQLAADNVRETLNSRQQRVEIFELAEITNEIQEFFDLLGSFLLGLGGISLVVAGVSIFNVMLMSTVERRGEIGVMRAVGIEKRDVMRMLLSEAGLIGAAGGVTGVILTALVVVGLVTATPAERSMVLVTQNVWYLLLALGFGITVGIVSGLYPAWKAANERPVTALRE